MKSGKLWFTVNDAAEYLGVSAKFVRSLMEDGLSFYKVRKLVFLNKDEIDNYIAKHKII